MFWGSRGNGEGRLDEPGDDREAGAIPAHSPARTEEGPATGQAARAKRSAAAAAALAGASTEPGSDQMEDLLHVDPLELEIGFRLIGLADPVRGGDLLGRLKTVRQRVAREMGLIVPQVRIHDEIGLPPHEYRVKIRGTIVGQGIAYAGRLLAVPPAGPGDVALTAATASTPSPAMPAVWIHADGREVAELAGCRVLEASAVVAGHFGEIVASHADELLTREQVERLLDRVRSTAPTLVGEVVPGLLRAGELQRSAAEPAPRAGQHPRPGDDPGDAGRARRQDQGHRSFDRASAAEPGAADHRDVSRARRPAPCRRL